jgi:hypothetical protein
LPKSRRKRPAGATGATVGRIAKKPTLNSAAAELGSKGGKARAAAMTKKRRAEIAKKAAAARWKAAKR